MKNTKLSMGGQYRHQLARHAAATLVDEVRNIAPDEPSRGATAIRRDLRSAAEMVAAAVALACNGTMHRKASPHVGAIRVALARLEANMLIAGACGEITISQAMSIEPMLNYLLSYCGAVGERRPTGQAAPRPDA